MTFTAVYEQDGGWWVGYVEELPGANAQGATLDEARDNLREAVELIVAANRDLARQDATDKAVIREPLDVTI
jgi:predicted RNase H-like HicB family nuclease